jgi:hypothetical protein
VPFGRSCDGAREVHLGFLAADASGCHVVCSCGLLSGVVGAKPDSDALAWVSDFSCPFAPRAPPDPSVLCLSLPAVDFGSMAVEFHEIGTVHLKICIRGDKKNHRLR